MLHFTYIVNLQILKINCTLAIKVVIIMLHLVKKSFDLSVVVVVGAG